MKLQRRTFLKAAVFFPLGVSAGKALQAAGSGYLLNRFSIAGFRYYEGPQRIRSLRIGEPLLLKAEPENPYDPFAVQIFRKRRLLGYVPRSDNRHISRLLRQGVKLRSRIAEVHPDRPPWQMVKVEVRLPYR